MKEYIEREALAADIEHDASEVAKSDADHAQVRADTMQLMADWVRDYPAAPIDALVKAARALCSKFDFDPNRPDLVSVRIDIPGAAGNIIGYLADDEAVVAAIGVCCLVYGVCGFFDAHRDSEGGDWR